MNKQVRDNPKLYRSHASNAIVNTDNYGYSARQKQKAAADAHTASIESLTAQVAELRELATGILQMLKNKDNQ